ncbi:MAG TPA: SRPBCC domain-containing protein [Chloroflexota bacterium]
MTTVDTPSFSVTPQGERDIVMTRTFNAPRRLVFDAWTRPELLRRWYGARGWTLPVCEVDLRPGGGYRFVMRGPDGAEVTLRGTYREVSPPERLVSTEAFEGFSEEGWRAEDESVSSMVLAEADGKTTWTLTTNYPSREVRDAAFALKQAWEGMGYSLDRLEEVLRTRDLVVTRVFDAPVERLWRAWSSAEDVKQWWGPRGFTAPVAKMDFREGGSSLVCMRAPDGMEFWNTWSYQRIDPLKRIEHVMGFADKDGRQVAPSELGLPPDLAREVPHVIVFEADGSRTRLIVTEQGYTNEQTLEMSRQGLEQCLDKMEALVRSG